MENGIEYLNSLGLHKVKPGLERIHKLLKSLDNPENKVPSILIAGTNGKGSVASAIAAVLSAHGYKVGLYTSPHLVRITERIKINNLEISEPELSSVLNEIKKIVENSSETSSYFEVITAAAFVYFARNNNDINVLEVGMGGRWDATNVVTPLSSVITNISRDHSEYLGDTIAQIAGEKACIIKANVPVVTGATGEALNVIKNSATKNSSPLIIHGKDFITTGDDTSNFNYMGPSWKIEGLSSNLIGRYQLDNLATAIATLETINKQGELSIDEGSVRKGISNIDWSGRFELIREEPPLILDSAHNPGAANALVESIRSKYPKTNFNFLVAMLDDKGHDDFFEDLSTISTNIIITKAPSERTALPKQLRKSARKFIDNVAIVEDYQNAFEMIKNVNEPWCITGSIYLIGAIKNLMVKS